MLFFILFVSSKIGQRTKTKIGGKMTLAWKELRLNFSKICWGVWRLEHFSTFVIDNLINEPLWTKTVRLLAPGGFMLHPAPNC